MISVYPTKIEAVDEGTGDVVFKLSTFDDCSAELVFNTLVSPGMLPDLFDAIKRGVDLLDLKTGTN